MNVVRLRTRIWLSISRRNLVSQEFSECPWCAVWFHIARMSILISFLLNVIYTYLSFMDFTLYYVERHQLRFFPASLLEAFVAAIYEKHLN